MSPDSLCSRTRLMLPWELTSLWSTHSVMTPILNFSKHISSHLKGRGYHFDFSEKKQSSHLSIFRSLYNSKYANLLLCVIPVITQHSSSFPLDPLSCLPLHYPLLIFHSIYFTSFFQANHSNSFVFVFLKISPLCSSG